MCFLFKLMQFAVPETNNAASSDSPILCIRLVPNHNRRFCWSLPVDHERYCASRLDRNRGIASTFLPDAGDGAGNGNGFSRYVLFIVCVRFFCDIFLFVFQHFIVLPASPAQSEP